MTCRLCSSHRPPRSRGAYQIQIFSSGLAQGHWPYVNLKMRESGFHPRRETNRLKDSIKSFERFNRKRRGKKDQEQINTLALSVGISCVPSDTRRRKRRWSRGCKLGIREKCTASSSVGNNRCVGWDSPTFCRLKIRWFFLKKGPVIQSGRDFQMIHLLLTLRKTSFHLKWSFSSSILSITASLVRDFHRLLPKLSSSDSVPL